MIGADTTRAAHAEGSMMLKHAWRGLRPIGVVFFWLTLAMSVPDSQNILIGVGFAGCCWVWAKALFALAERNNDAEEWVSTAAALGLGIVTPLLAMSAWAAGGAPLGLISLLMERSVNFFWVGIVSCFLYLAFSTRRNKWLLPFGAAAIIAGWLSAYKWVAVPGDTAALGIYFGIGMFIVTSGFTRGAAQLAHGSDPMARIAVAHYRRAFRHPTQYAAVILGGALLAIRNAVQYIAVWPALIPFSAIVSRLSLPKQVWKTIKDGSGDSTTIGRHLSINTPIWLIDTGAQLLVVGALFTLSTFGVSTTLFERTILWLVMTSQGMRHVGYAFDPLARQLRLQTQRPYLFFLIILIVEGALLCYGASALLAEGRLADVGMQQLSALRSALYRPGDWFEAIKVGALDKVLAINICVLLFSTFLLSSLFRKKEFRATSEEFADRVMRSLQLRNAREAERTVKLMLRDGLGNKSVGALVAEAALNLAQGKVDEARQNVRIFVDAEKIPEPERATAYILLSLCFSVQTRQEDVAAIVRAGLTAKMPDALFALLSEGPVAKHYRLFTLLSTACAETGNENKLMFELPLTVARISRSGPLGPVAAAFGSLGMLSPKTALSSNVAFLCFSLFDAIQEHARDRNQMHSIVANWEQRHLTTVQEATSAISDRFEIASIMFYLRRVTNVLRETGREATGQMEDLLDELSRRLGSDKLLGEVSALTTLLKYI